MLQGLYCMHAGIRGWEGGGTWNGSIWLNMETWDHYISVQADLSLSLSLFLCLCVCLSLSLEVNMTVDGTASPFTIHSMKLEALKSILHDSSSLYYSQSIFNTQSMTFLSWKTFFFSFVSNQRSSTKKKKKERKKNSIIVQLQPFTQENQMAIDLSEITSGVVGSIH